MHTDNTLKIFDDVTVRIGAECRKFNKKTCPTFDTRELKCETRARKRRQAEKAARGIPAPVPAGSFASGSEADAPLPKEFNLDIYKYHALGDYPKTIRELGTSDSYSSEPVSTSDRCTT
jgi:hypothetical protein